MHCCIPTPTTDSNTSTGMIWVTLNMPSATEECREPSEKCQGIWYCLESGHPVLDSTARLFLVFDYVTHSLPRHMHFVLILIVDILSTSIICAIEHAVQAVNVSRAS